MIVVDRVEGSVAILEIDGVIVQIPASALPQEAHEGSVLTLTLVAAPDLLREAEERLKRLRARGPQGDDIDLT